MEKWGGMRKKVGRKRRWRGYEGRKGSRSGDKGGVGKR